ncbi:MAG: ribonuclease III domain-containing protein [Cyanobacteria bacterium J06627_28]
MKISQHRQKAIRTLLSSDFFEVADISDKALKLYNQAFTHSSYAKEQRDQSHACEDYERLEFLGDRILNSAVADFLYHHYDQATPKTLSDKIKFTQNENLAHLVKTQTPDVKLLLRLGNGQSLNDAILADTFESLIAAIYLDPRQGLAKIHWIVNGPLSSAIKAFNISEDYVSRLQMRIQQILRKDHLTSDDFEYCEVSHHIDSQSNHLICYEVRLNGEVIGKGSGSNSKAAKQSAAQFALSTLKCTE